MNTRSPKQGFKGTQVEGAAMPLSFVPTEVPTPAPEMSAADRENPGKLSGEALRHLAHRRGMSLSELDGMPDAKVRMQLLYITNRQYADEVS